MQILTPEGEAFWPAVFRPAKPMQEGKEPQYQLTIGWSKDDEPDGLDRLRDAILEVATEKFGKKAEQMLAKGQLKNPLRDGDDAGQDYLDGLWYFTARSTDRPDVVDEDVEDIIDQKDFYGGCIARMDVYLYAFDKAGNRGVSAILNNVQKTGDGERKGGGRSAGAAFGDKPKSGSSKSGKKKSKKKSSDKDSDLM